MGREAVEATMELEMHNSGSMSLAAMEQAKVAAGSARGEGVLELRALPTDGEDEAAGKGGKQ